MALVYYGMQRRHEDATMVHAHSSRSHLIVQLTIYTITNSNTTSSSSDAAPSPPGTPTRSRRTLPTPSAGHSSRSQSPAPKSKGASTKRSRWVVHFSVLRSLMIYTIIINLWGNICWGSHFRELYLLDAWWPISVKLHRHIEVRLKCSGKGFFNWVDRALQQRV